MSFLGKLFSSPVVSAAEGIANVVDRFVETPEEKRTAEIIKQRIQARPQLAQIELNKIEARHRSVFVAGWRPAVGWVCAVGLAWHYVLHDLIAWYCAAWAPHITPPELAGTDNLITILLAMLGMAGVRSVEKLRGVTR